MHLKLHEECSNADSASVTTETATDASAMCNAVVTSGTVEANRNLSPAANIDDNECTIDAADEAVESSPPKQSADESED